jgi:hypothetical protein
MVGKEEYCVFKRERGTGVRAVNETAVVRSVFPSLRASPARTLHMQTTNNRKDFENRQSRRKKMDARMLAQRPGCGRGRIGQFRVQSSLPHLYHSHVITGMYPCDGLLE